MRRGEEGRGGERRGEEGTGGERRGGGKEGVICIYMYMYKNYTQCKSFFLEYKLTCIYL